MTAWELIQKVEAAGGTLELRGDRIHYRLPSSATPILSRLKANRDEVVRILHQRSAARVALIPSGAILLAPRYDGVGRPLASVPRCWCCQTSWRLERLQKWEKRSKGAARSGTYAFLEPGCACLDAPQALACCGLCVDHCQCSKPSTKPENTVLADDQEAEQAK